MSSTKLLVKNMVCHRCVLAVEEILKSQGLSFHHVSTGEIDLCVEPSEDQRKQLGLSFEKIGLELIDNRMHGLVEKMKHHIIKKARNEVSEKENRMKLSNYLSSKLNYEYTYLSSFFSSVEGRTIENYFIEQRIEKAKELIVYGQLTLSDIAFELEYSSVAHLSSQFKKITGLTPSYFKEVGANKRKSIDDV